MKKLVIGYHITPAKNISSIMKQGIIPSVSRLHSHIVKEHFGTDRTSYHTAHVQRHSLKHTFKKYVRDFLYCISIITPNQLMLAADKYRVERTPSGTHFIVPDGIYMNLPQPFEEQYVVLRTHLNVSINTIFNHVQTKNQCYNYPFWNKLDGYFMHRCKTFYLVPNVVPPTCIENIGKVVICYDGHRFRFRFDCKDVQLVYKSQSV